MDSSTPGTDKVLALGVGGTPPGDWANTVADVSGWESSVDGTGINTQFPIPGATWVSPSAYAGALPGGEVFVLRHHFTLPAGTPGSATLQIAPNDYVLAVFINGVGLTATGGTNSYGGVLTYTIDGSVLHERGDPWDGNNVLAIQIQNISGAGAAGSCTVQFALDVPVDTSGTDTTSGSGDANRGAYGQKLGVSTVGRGAVLARHESGDVAWEHDGVLFRVRNRDKTVLQTPFPVMSEQPLAMLGKDPSTGLPMWTDADALKNDLPVDTGGHGQVPGADSTLPDDPPVSTTLQTDKPLPPVALPDPIVDNCPIMRCGAAYYLAQKLKEQYDIVRNCLLGMLAAPLLLRIPAAGAPFGITILDLIIARLSDSLIGQFGAEVLWLTRTLTKLSRWAKVAGVSFSVARDFEDIHEEGITILQRLAYPCLTCSENIFNFTEDMRVAWELAINADTADFTDWQRHLLIYILQCTPFGVYHTVAAQGAAITSDTCGGF